ARRQRLDTIEEVRIGKNLRRILAARSVLILGNGGANDRFDPRLQWIVQIAVIPQTAEPPAPRDDPPAFRERRLLRDDVERRTERDRVDGAVRETGLLTAALPPVNRQAS